MEETSYSNKGAIKIESDFIIDEPLVSIIVATFRRDTTLEKALLSLLQQNYTNIHIIVVDDNADKIWNKKVNNIISSIKSKTNNHITYVQNEVNKGSAETRNIGIKAALGEYITFLDDDDLYLADKLSNQIGHMIEANSDYCITDLNLYDESDRLIEKRNRNYIKKYDKDSLIRYHLMHHMTGTDTMMFKRDYIVAIGGFPPINIGDEFYLIEKAIIFGGKFSYLRKCDIKAYVHTETDGLSSGEGKIIGENKLYEYKKKYFKMLTNKEIKYINMRHFAVLAFAEFRRKNIRQFILYSIDSFISSPLNCINLIIKK